MNSSPISRPIRGTFEYWLLLEEAVAAAAAAADGRLSPEDSSLMRGKPPSRMASAVAMAVNSLEKNPDP